MIKQTIICDYCSEEIKHPDQPWLTINGELHGHMGAGTVLFPKELHFHYTCWMQALSNARMRPY